MSGLLSIRNVSKRFGSFTAVSSFNIEIADGEFLTFLGPSGSGKSTLLYMIAGLESVTGGDIDVAGSSLISIPPHKRNIGMVFQRYTLIPHLSVAENIAFPLRVRRWTRGGIDQRVSEMLSLVRLTQFRDRLPAQLSGGQQQRVALARALSYHPKILLMDEPLAALDKKLKEELQSEIRRIHRETGVTILYVTHDQEEALRLSDRIAVFNNGRLEQLATPSVLYEQPKTRFVASFIGNCNFLEVLVHAVNGEHATVEFPDGTRAEDIRVHGSVSPGDKGAVLLRPEKISTARNGRSHAYRLPVKVSDMTYLGEIVELAGETAWGQPMTARIPATEAGLNANGRANLEWHAGDALLFGGTETPSAPH